MNESIAAGFVYVIEEIRDGQVVHRQEVHNILPTQGINHMLGVLGKSVVQVPTWYLLLYENDYIPSPADTAATFPAAAGESTLYVGATRPAIVFGDVVDGSLSNVLTRNEVEFTEARTIRGGAIVSTAAKGSTSGILLSAVRFSSPRQVDANTILRVTAGIQIASTS